MMKLFKLVAAGLLAASAFVGVAQASPGFVMFYADIKNDGTIYKTSGAQSSSRIALGRYQVVFPRTIYACALTANTPSGVASVLRNATAGIVEVRTYNIDNTPGDRAFNLLVVCNQ